MTILKEIATSISARGGEAFYVGGYVRDRYLGRENKDIDIEVHGISPETLKHILSEYGEVYEAGKSFGVYRIKGYDIDFCMPRKERKTGDAHTSFDVTVDPFLGTKEASRRRDFTINSLMENVLTGEIIDHWGGMFDLRNGIIRHIDDEKFKEDALRVFRAARFAAKLNFMVAEETVELCQSIDTTKLSSERVFSEMANALMGSNTPSVFFELLEEMSQLHFWFKELQDCIGVMQNQHFHHEGDVWTHTMLVLDNAAKKRQEAQRPLEFMLSALCHDLGKPKCTSEDPTGVIHSVGHEEAGVAVAKEFLSRLTSEKKIISYVLNMVELHGEPHAKANSTARVKSTNKMFDKSIAPSDLVLLSRCDNLGKLPSADDAREFLEERLRVFEATMSKPYVMGRDLIAAGLKPDERFSELLSLAHKLRLAGVDKESALKQVLAAARQR